ncbi:MCE family protein [Nocardia abscessus]|jgi:phospholipid/cholesterol/gamma-HCH transport system substrate-binding protein|nr:MCE family protein [Nocardia abscessus]
MIRNSKGTVAVLTAAAVAAASGAAYASISVAHSDVRSGYCAEMPDSVGLYNGNPVTQMGVVVGKVTGIASKGDHVEVTFSLDGGRRFPAEAKAVTRSKSLLADRSVELVGNYSSGPELVTGRCIPLDHSYTPKSISEITGSAADFIDALAPSDGRQGLQRALAGMDASLQGNGRDAAALMQHAAAAMTSPDQMISDIGTAIVNMAPLTDETLQRWSTIRSILDQAPEVVDAATYDLMPGVLKLTAGVNYISKTLYDIQRHYGDQIWPFVHGSVTDAVHLAATHSKDIAELMSAIPAVTGALVQQTQNPDGLTITYQQPTVQIGGDATNVMPLLDLLLTKAAR